MSTIDDPCSAITMLDKLDKRLGELYKRESDLYNQIQRIRQLGVTDATPYWRAGAYLYLIHPTVNGERRREYIGGNPQKIAEAFDRINRLKEIPPLEKSLAEVQAAISTVKYYLAQALVVLDRALVTDQPWPEAASTAKLSPMEQQL